MEPSSAFNVATVLADAQRKESVTDWGPGEFERPLSVLLDDYAGADLNAIGIRVLRSGIVHSLRMRLRAQNGLGGTRTSSTSGSPRRSSWSG